MALEGLEYGAEDEKKDEKDTLSGVQSKSGVSALAGDKTLGELAQRFEGLCCKKKDKPENYPGNLIDYVP